MNVTLRPELEKLVNEMVASGAYESADAVIAEALRLLHDRDQNGKGTERARFEEALDLYVLGVDMMVQNLRREFSGASQEEINRRLRAWLESNDAPDHTPEYFRVAPERLKQLIR